MSEFVTCPNCQAELFEPTPSCPDCGAALDERAPHLPLPPEAARRTQPGVGHADLTLVPASHLKRFGAAFIDGLVLFAFYFLVEATGLANPFSFSIDSADFLAGSTELEVIGGVLIGMLTPFLYGAFLEASRYEGTLGKHLFGLRVCSDEGQPLMLMHSFARNVAKTVVNIVPLAQVVILFNRKRRGIHDMLASTRVVERITPYKRRR